MKLTAAIHPMEAAPPIKDAHCRDLVSAERRCGQSNRQRAGSQHVAAHDAKDVGEPRLQPRLLGYQAGVGKAM